MTGLVALNRGDAVQIVDPTSDWYGCILIVGEVLSSGVMAAVVMPAKSSVQGMALAWLRIKFADLYRVGESKILLHDPSDGEGL